MNKNKNVLSTKWSHINSEVYETIASGRMVHYKYTSPVISPLAQTQYDLKKQTQSNIKKHETLPNINATKNKLGVYLVNIRILHTKENKLHYSYIYYPPLFIFSLFNFLIIRNIGVSEWREPGPYLPILDYDLWQ